MNEPDKATCVAKTRVEIKHQGFLDRMRINRTSFADVLYPVGFPGFLLSLLTRAMAKTNKLSFSQQSAFDGAMWMGGLQSSGSQHSI